MPSPAEWLEPLLRFLERGGPVQVVILAVSVLMWVLILDRYWFFLRRYPRLLEATVAHWKAREDHSSWYARRIREGLVADLSLALQRHLGPIKAMTELLPLLGLLGTVVGMIATFEVIKVFGTGNARGLASGISVALLTTIGGLVTAISGLYCSAHLDHKAERERQRAMDLLV